MSLYQAHILLNNGVADLTIPFTNRLSEFIILLLKLNTKVGMFISGEIDKKKKKKKKKRLSEQI